ncbi:VgrG-related protein, partial [Vibrio cholerae]
LIFNALNGQNMESMTDKDIIILVQDYKLVKEIDGLEVDIK